MTRDEHLATLADWIEKVREGFPEGACEWKTRTVEEVESMPIDRDEHRAQCIEAMARAFCDDIHLICTFPDCGCKSMPRRATAAFDALHGIAFVNSPEPQELTRLGYSLLTIKRWKRMAAAGDLTNAPEKKL